MGLHIRRCILVYRNRKGMPVKSLRELLNAQQFKIAGLVAEARSNKDIGLVLHLTPHTVKNYLRQIFDKLGCDNRVVLAVRYVREEGTVKL
jgi:DNA-binding CsgD family transcriptional regulator